MATADQIKSLLHSHYKNDDERFTSIALQVAAHEARKGNMAIAKFMGISTAIISEGLGHSSLKTTEIYLKRFDSEVLDDANELIVA